MPNFNENNIGFTKFLGPGNGDQAIGSSAKGHGTKIFLQHVFMGLQVFLAEFGKTYIIFIEIRHGTCRFFS
jgi:hypothetical protein